MYKYVCMSNTGLNKSYVKVGQPTFTKQVKKPALEKPTSFLTSLLIYVKISLLVLLLQELLRS